MIEKVFDFIKCGSPLGEYELHCNEQTKQQIESHYKIVDFLNEVEEQGWDLDADDIRHILDEDFDYIRKQEQIAVPNYDIDREIYDK